jgi:hypothetical protein
MINDEKAGVGTQNTEFRIKAGCGLFILSPDSCILSFIHHSSFILSSYGSLKNHVLPQLWNEQS